MLKYRGGVLKIIVVLVQRYHRLVIILYITVIPMDPVNVTIDVSQCLHAL